MALFPIPVSVYEKIKAAARNEVYDVLFRVYDADIEEPHVVNELIPSSPNEIGIELIEDLSIKP